jgi:hypothetical protein
MMIRTHREYELINHFHRLEDKTPALVALFAMAVRTSNDHPLVRPHYDTLIPEIQEELKQFVMDKMYQQEIMLIKLLLLQMMDNHPLDIMDYMKAVILPYLQTHQHRVYTEYYVETYLSLLESCSRYKEAITFAKKYIRYVKNLNKDED